MMLKNMFSLLPREKLIKRGASQLKDKELLAILLRTGTQKRNVLELSEQLLRKIPLTSWPKSDLQTFMEISGIDTAKASTILAAIELGTRLSTQKDTQYPSISSPNDVLYALQDIRKLKKEHFVVLLLNGRNQLIHQEVVSIGTLNASIVHPREVFEPALRLCAGALIVAHNHPSGDTSPSDEDLKVTERIKEAGKIMGIEILDHLILSSHSYFSFKEHNLI